MSGTDELLRRLLDERGVDHEDYDGTVVRTTSWTANDGQSVTFMERLDNGKTMFGFDTSAFTPEEAVAATLGRGTCQMETDDSCQNWNSCSECGADYYTDQPINFCPNCGRKVVDA